MKQVLISILLILVAIILLILLLVPAIIWQSKCIFKGHRPYSYMSKLLFSIAQCIDELGNVAYQELWNDFLITNDGYKFGNPHETISSSLGKNVEGGTLTKWGKLLNNILDKIQPNHSIISIQRNIDN